MAAGETAKLLASLDFKDNLTPGVNKAIASVGRLETRMSRIGQGVGTIGRGIGTAIRNGALLAGVALGGLVALIGRSIAEGQEAAKVQAVYAKAMQNSGKVSADYVRVLDEQQTALMNLAGVDDELIKAEQTKLIQMNLTGKQVATLTPLILDLSEATGKDLLTSTVAVGKAVNGSAGSLQKFGVFVDKAKFKVDPFAATMEALNQKFGGTTKALSGSLQARLGALRENLANIREEAGIKLLPAITRIVDVAGKDLVPAFGKFVDRIMPSLISGIEQFADMLEHGGAERGIKAITDALGPMVELLKLAAAPIKAIVQAFLSLPSQVQGVLIGAFAVNKLSGGLIAQGVGQVAGGIFQRGGSPANPLFVADVAGGLGKGASGVAPVGGALGLASKVFLVGEAIGLGLLVNAVREDIGAQNTARAQAIAETQAKWLSQQPSRADLEKGLAGVEKGIRDIESNPLNVLVQGDALAELKGMRDDIKSQLGGTTVGNFGRTAPDPKGLEAGIIARAVAAGFKPSAEAIKLTLARNLARIEENTYVATVIARENIAAIKDQGSTPQAITNVKVNVNVTAAQVQKSVTIQRRYGPSGGSRSVGGPSDHGPLI